MNSLYDYNQSSGANSNDKKQKKHDTLCDKLANDLRNRYGYKVHREVPFHDIDGTLRYIADVVAELTDSIRVYEVKGSERGYARGERQLEKADMCCRHRLGYVPHMLIVTEVDDEYKIRRFN